MNRVATLQSSVVSDNRQRAHLVPPGVVWWLVKTVFVVGVGVAALIWLSFQVVYAWGALNERMDRVYRAAMARVTKVEVRRELVRSDAVPLGQLVDIASRKHRIPAVVLQAVVDQESSGGEFLYRFEPGTYSQLKVRARMSDSEVRMLASSHGVAHVMGFNAQPRCGVHWSKLYDPAIGLECGAKILRESMDKYRTVKDSSRRVWLALRDYNGSGPDAEAYASKVMARVGALLLGDGKVEM